MNLRTVKKVDLYPVLDEIQEAFRNKYNSETIRQTNSNTYGSYNRELVFLFVYSSTEMRKLSNELHNNFNKLYVGFEKVYIKDFPKSYTDDIKDYFGAEVVAYYISTERLNDLPINDDLRLARFIIKNKETILKIIKE